MTSSSNKSKSSTRASAGPEVPPHESFERNKISSKYVSISAYGVPEGLGFCGHGSKHSLTESSPCREDTTFHSKLESSHIRPLGTGLCARVCNRLDCSTPSSETAPRNSLFRGRDELSFTRSAKDGRETCCYGSTDEEARERIHFSVVCSPEEGRGCETNNKSEESQHLCEESFLQDGRNSHSQRPAKAGRLDDESRSKGRLLCDPDNAGTHILPEISVDGKDVPVQLPTFRSVVGSMGLYQDHEANNGFSQDTRTESNHLHRRYSDSGRKRRESSSTHNVPDLSTRKLGFHSKPNQIPSDSNPGDRIPRVDSELRNDGAEVTLRQDQEDQVRGEKSTASRCLDGVGSFQISGQTEPCGPSNRCGTIVLQTPAEVSTSVSRGGESRVLPSLPSVTRCQRGTDMVDGSPVSQERETTPVGEAGHGDRDRCIHNRLGSIFQQCSNRRTMVPTGTTHAHQLPGITGGIPCDQELCQGCYRCCDPSKDGQHDCPDLHQQTGRNRITGTQPVDERALGVVLSEEYHSQSLSSRGFVECDCRRGIPSDERQIGLDAMPENLSKDKLEIRPTGCGPLCLSTVPSTPTVCELETRPSSNSHRCLHNELESFERLCQPTLELDRQSPATSPTTECRDCACGTGMAGPSVVPNAIGHADPRALPHNELQKPDPTNSPSQRTGDKPTPSRVEYLRSRYSAENLSGEASKLLLASWRQKSAKTYDSLFKKWACWCVERDIDPISGDIAGVVNFLASLYQNKYQYRSLCNYRSAISSIHDKVDGYEVGSHPMVSRLLKGVFHERPPQPRYSSTWDVSKVTTYLVSLGQNEQMSLQDITFKITMLLALTRPSRSVDLVNLDIRFRQFSPEGVTFHPTKLAKQSRQNKKITEFFFPAFKDNALLCPVQTLKDYESRTLANRADDEKQAQLLIATIQPYKAVSSSTVARWIKTVLAKAGIDTDIFKAHSVRSAATSAAADAGVTTTDILSAADWSSESIFQKFYYKPQKNNTFGKAVLSTKLSTTDKLQNHVDMETEHSEI